MKKLILFLMAGAFASVSIGQDLPQPSPLSTTTQIVGLTNISIAYSRPSVKGRTIWGDLVKYDEVWRLGANAPTKITTDATLMIANLKLEAGAYALFAIPKKDGNWTFVFNTDTDQWGAGNYDEAKNVLTVEAKPMAHEMTETLTIEIADITSNSAAIVIRWDKIKVVLPFTVNTTEMAEANIKAAIEKGEDLEKVYAKAASYYFSSMNDNKKAMEYADKSMGIKKTHNAMFLQARIYHAEGKKEEAIKSAEEALKLAKEAEANGWIDYIEESIADWKK